uniref:Retrovirus-related Pol polyprotein from transposon TNT 1-94 n=1 Tax=Tanacetum cinerariifolium TaxID=118510 RepID=A0A699GMS0_TANCI|nr:retrovirus-related Pol polyprotein from transposon TNT 1-94 [Tanacetum cinerariifolium]
MEDMLLLEGTPKEGKSHEKGKQHRASYKLKIENSISLPLHLLHMDFFGLTSVKSLMKKIYCLVVTDDYSRFTWVFFLATKDETSGILKSFITEIENLIDHKLKVAERRNMTLIEAARTMLADSKLPTNFWAEAVNTTCYVQNRVLVVKPHNKTPYKLFHCRTSTLSFIRPFGCPVTILHTIDHLGKFNGKAGEGFFVGYSLNNKAFRVFNSRTRIVEENLHIRFSESTPNVVSSGSDWLFGIDALTRTLNYEPIVADRKSFNDDGSKPSSDDGKKVDEDPRKGNKCTKWVFRNKKDERGIVIRNKARLVAQRYTQEKGIDYDELFTPVARIKAIRLLLAYDLFKDFVVYQMDVKSAFLYEMIREEVYVYQPPGFEDPDFLNRVYMVEKALYGLHQAPKAWHKSDILLVQVYVDDIIFGSIKKELCSAFEKLMHEKFHMSSMGELAFFLGLQVNKKKDGIFISKNKYVAEILKKFRFIEVKTASTLMETQKPLFNDEDGEEVDVHMYRSMIGSLMYLTSSRPDILFAVCAYARYQVNPKVLHLHAVKKSFRASLDRMSTTGYYQFLGCRLISWQCKKQTVVANSTTKAEYVAASSSCGQFWSTAMAKTINGEVQLHAQVDGKEIIITESSVRRDLQLPDEEGIDCLPNSTIFEQLALMGLGKGFSGKVTPLFPTMVQQLGEGSTIPTDPQHTSIIIQPSSSQPQKIQKPKKPKRKDTQVPQPSDPTDNVADKAVHKELGDRLVRAATTASSLEAEQDSGNTLRSDEDSMKLDELMAVCTTLQNRVLDLEKIKTTQRNKIDSLKRKVKKLEKRNRSRTHKLKRLYKVGLIARVESSGDEESLGEDASKQERRTDAIDADEDITLVNDVDNEMFDVDTSVGEEMFVAGQNENVVKEVVDAAQVSNAATTVTITTEEITLAQALEALKTSKPKDDIQAKIDTDHQLVKRLQAQEQEELSDAEKAILFQQPLEKRRNHFAAKRGEEKRNKPPTKSQQRKIMCTYLKNMEGYKLKDLKLKEFDRIQEMFDKAFKMSMQNYMLVEKKYPLTPPTLLIMLEKKIQIDYETRVSAASELQRKYAKCLLLLVQKLMLLVKVKTASTKLMLLRKLILLVNFNEKYFK